MKRFKHSLSHTRLATMNMGELIPVNCQEVLPGDTFQQSTSALIRVSPLVAPVMHPVQVRIHHWFVPYRLVWSGWEDFITGGEDGQGGSAGPYPTISAPGAGFVAGELMDYLGVPPGVADLVVGAMPVRAYNKIFNDFYRDQDLVAPVVQDSVSFQRIAWQKDYFTQARPWPQKGPDVTMPLGVRAPIATDGNLASAVGVVSTAQGGALRRFDASTAALTLGSTAAASPDDLYADLTNATAVNVNDVRRAFALQRYEEARARYGSRFTEYLRYLGIRSSDARLQRPEYLGGGKQTISFSEVLKTGSGEDPTVPIGNMSGHGIAALRSNRWRRFFEEHGVVLSLMSIRPKTMYTEGMSRMWSKRLKEDYFQRELEAIGQQEVYSRELFAESDVNGGSDVFGYQNRYEEYRNCFSSVHSEFRTLLDYWHMSRSFATAPVLNESFITCDPTKRIYAEQTQDSLWVMIANNITARRMVNRSAASRIY